MSVLSVSYDESLLKSRELLLKRFGFEVRSIRGFVEALRACEAGDYDLLILGNSIPDADKLELMKRFRTSCPAPFLELYASNEVPTGAAEYSFEISQNPAEFVSLVKEIVADSSLSNQRTA